MKTLGRLHVCGDLLVTGKAEGRLRSLVKGSVTGRAISLELVMGLRERARRNKLLDDVLRARAGRR